MCILVPAPHLYKFSADFEVFKLSANLASKLYTMMQK